MRIPWFITRHFWFI